MGDSLTPYDYSEDEDLFQSGERSCNYCVDKSDTKACRPCNSSRVRIHRNMAVDEQPENAWLLVRNKEDLIAKAKGAYGDALFKLLKTTMVEEHSEKSEISFIGTGNWTDEQDLRIRYKDRPERLAAILQNSKRWIEPGTGIVLIEELTYTSVSASSETHSSREKRSFEGTEKNKQPKKAKVVKTEGEENLSNDSKKK